MTETPNTPTIQPKQIDTPLPCKADLQLLLWNNCKYLKDTIELLKTSDRKVSKKYGVIVALMNAQSGYAKVLLESMKEDTPATQNIIIDVTESAKSLISVSKQHKAQDHVS
jgi:hypothetical protein